MKKIFIDSNVILRILTRDDENQFKKAEQLFTRAINGEVMLYCGPPVLFEVVWTLEARYKVPSGAILDYLEALLATSGLVIIDRNLVEKAVSKSRQSGIEFPDAYVSVLAEEHECDEIATFNISDFRKLGIKLHPF